VSACLPNLSLHMIITLTLDVRVADSLQWDKSYSLYGMLFFMQQHKTAKGSFTKVYVGCFYSNFLILAYSNFTSNQTVIDSLHEDLYGHLPSTRANSAKYFAHETATRRNPHNSSNWDTRFTGQSGYKHTFCQNVVWTKKLLVPTLP